ncbi:MAG: rod shape-determining protein MreC [Eubacteriales bacterium]|nr:rod shape-determining protein MreC [Eubacteriales bacterium]
MKKFFKKLKYHIQPKNKHILIIMTMFCLSLILATFASGLSVEPLRTAAGVFIVPFEKSINQAGLWLVSIRNLVIDKEELLQEKEELEQKVDTLTAENNYLLQNQTELTRLKELYKLDEEYSDYPKISAKIIAKDPGNWYSNFIIDKGSNDGVQEGHNVIAGKGLVGLVTEVGPDWASVESIINDTSNVSAQTVSTSAGCIVQGDLELIDSGMLRFVQMNDEEDKVTVGERIVTSHISEKYVEGLFIGYVAQVEQDSNNLTKTGTIVTPVDFSNLKHVFVITMSKAAQLAGEESTGEE